MYVMKSSRPVVVVMPISMPFWVLWLENAWFCSTSFMVPVSCIKFNKIQLGYTQETRHGHHLNTSENALNTRMTFAAFQASTRLRKCEVPNDVKHREVHPFRDDDELPSSFLRFGLFEKEVDILLYGGFLLPARCLIEDGIQVPALSTVDIGVRSDDRVREVDEVVLLLGVIEFPVPKI
jgi:hypothetical protein